MSGRRLFSFKNTPKTPAPEMKALEASIPSQINTPQESNELFHYTSKKGYDQIMKSQELLPSLDPKHAKFGEG